MKEIFEKYSMPDLNLIEGGKVDDPVDPGGRTNRGVTQYTYNVYRKSNGLPAADVYNMTSAEEDAIYKAQFWDRIHGDDMPPGIDYVLMDGAVNSGPSESVKWLQSALGVTVDGVLGLNTMAAVQNYSDPDVLIAKICAQRLAFDKELKTWWKYKNGWTSRINHVRIRGQALAFGSVGPTPVYFNGGDHKARITDARPAPSPTLAAATGTGGFVATLLAQLQAALAPASTWAPVEHLLTTLTVAGGLIGVAGYAYSAYAKYRNQKRDAALLLNLPPVPIVSSMSDTKGTIKPTPQTSDPTGPDPATPTPITVTPVTPLAASGVEETNASSVGSP